MNTPYNYYAFARRIARKLSKAGYDDWCSRILNAIDGGSTSGEIFADLGSALNELKDSSLAIEESLRNEIVDLLSKIDKVLKQ